MPSRMALGASIIMARLELGDEKQVEQIHGEGGGPSMAAMYFCLASLALFNNP